MTDRKGCPYCGADCAVCDRLRVAAVSLQNRVLELTREAHDLRAENEGLYRSWNIDAEYRDEVIKAAEAVIADWDRNPEYEPVSGEALRAQISGSIDERKAT